MKIICHRGYWKSSEEKNSIEAFERGLSEFEPWVYSLASQVKTIWLDAFGGVWYAKSYIEDLLEKGFEVLLVSDELHGRDPQGQWALLDSLSKSDKLTLCTDLPEEALQRFCC